MKDLRASSKRPAAAPDRHIWRFARSGGVDQAVFRNGGDIARLRELDLKLWMALAMPVRGIRFDPRTADLLDSDGDGRIRPEEVLAAVDWARGAFRSLDLLLDPGDSVPLPEIRDERILSAARLLLANLGKPGAGSVGMEDVLAQEKAFEGTLFNGDGVIPPEAADDEPTRKAIEDILSVQGSVTDRGGRPGIDQAGVRDFFAGAEAWLAWRKRGSEPSVSPLGPEAGAAAWDSIAAVRVKIDDYFLRCRLAAFDPRSAAVLNRGEDDYRALAASLLSESSGQVSDLPLSAAAAGKPLALDGSLNPAWTTRMAFFARNALEPVLGKETRTLDETAWKGLCSRFSAYEAWRSEEPATPAAGLGAGRLAELAAGDFRNRIETLIARDAALSGEVESIGLVEKLVRFRRDLYVLLSNYVNFSAFYNREGAIFQAGTLYLEARACSLCVEVLDEGKHAALAPLSGAFLAYCDLARPGGEKKKIVAAITDGDSDNLMVGRNGIFYDNDGRDWDATVVRLVSNAISVREAFWLPYKKFARMIEEQIAKRAQAGEAGATDKLARTAETVSHADRPSAGPKQAEPAKKLDLGTIALIGTAVGGISAMVASFLQTVFGLGIFMPLGLAGILLLISGPSMVLASLKLRRRNLGPLLDANGWAINTKARINIPFGASLTALAALPPGTLPPLSDPFPERRKPWRRRAWILVLLLALAAAAAWRFGWADRYLPESARYSSVTAGTGKKE